MDGSIEHRSMGSDRDDDDDGDFGLETPPRPQLFDVQMTFDGAFSEAIFENCAWFCGDVRDKAALRAKVVGAVDRMRALLAGPLAARGAQEVMSVGQRVEHRIHGRPGIVHVVVLRYDGEAPPPLAGLWDP